MLKAISDKGDDRHQENRERLQDIKGDVSRIEGEWKQTNGRLQNAERTLSQHRWAIYTIGAIAMALFTAVLAKILG
jgi:chromosome segregation ATPase